MILVGRGLAQQPRRWLKGLPPRTRLMLVSEPKAWRLHGAPVAKALRRAGARTSLHLLPGGEKAKTWDAVAKLMKHMLRQGLGRDSVLLALGGGSVTDAAGFAAAVYMRGIAWIGMPTTLVGQVDAGIGGKTAIDLAEGKNLVGAFHQPRAVVCDTDFLDTLPLRELASGLGEVLKYGLICDPALLRPARGLEPVVRRCAALKFRVVAKDERETKGIREVLNFGHTIGHALETAAAGRLRHGEAVVCGMRAALRLSRLADCLESFPVPRLRLSESAVMAILRRDKKARRGRLRFVLLKSVGRPYVTDRVPEREVREAVRFILGGLR
ncbi:MAG: 3-dehydroquinate synthase [Elusimicrobia bacterium]|nr:3-dehydroquinate synthase [Elusimicrobiota bacterium]